MLEKHPGNLWLALAMGEAESQSGRTAAANQRFAALLRRSPDNRVVALTFAHVLNEQGTAESGRQAQAVLRPLLGNSADNPVFQQDFGRANESLATSPAPGEAYAELLSSMGAPNRR